LTSVLTVPYLGGFDVPNDETEQRQEARDEAQDRVEELSREYYRVYDESLQAG
jgi:hypothetical protein